MTLDSKDDDDEDEDIKHGLNIFNQNGSEEDMTIPPLKGDILTEDERSKNVDRKKSNISNLHVKDPKPRASLKQELHKPPVNMSKTVAAATLSRDTQSFYPSLLGKFELIHTYSRKSNVSRISRT